MTHAYSIQVPWGISHARSPYQLTDAHRRVRAELCLKLAELLPQTGERVGVRLYVTTTFNDDVWCPYYLISGTLTVD